MTHVVGFMNGAAGRSTRGALGLALVVYGLAVLGGAIGLLVALIGVIPLALGLWGSCLLEPFAAGPSD